MKVAELIGFCAGFLFGSVETDNFALHQAQYGGSLYRLFNIYQYGDVATKVYLLFVFAAQVATICFATGRRLESFPFKGCLLAIGLLVIASVLRLSFEEGILVGVLGTEMREFSSILFLPLGTFCMVVWAPQAARLFMVGLLAGIASKAAVLVAAYFLQGGVPLYDTSASVFDGGVLSNLSLGALAFAGLAICRYERRADAATILLAVLSLLCLIIIIASYRRSIVLRTGLCISVASLILLYVQGRLWRLLPALLLAGATSVCAFAAVYIVVFGFDRTTDRFLSLFGLAHATELADSNRYYEDDQRTLAEVFHASSGLGVGFRREYGSTTRLPGPDNEQQYSIVETPLHVGIYELLARQGVFAIPFILAVFLVLPLIATRWLKLLGLEWQVAGSIAAAWLLVNGLWPYMPPPYTNQNIWVSFGAAIGLLAASRYYAFAGINRVVGSDRPAPYGAVV